MIYLYRNTKMLGVNSLTVRDNLKKGTAEMVILHLLKNEEMYGYQIAQELSKVSGGDFTLQEGSMYPTLYRLIAGGFVTDRNAIINKRLRKYYSITETGQERLEMLIAEFRAVTSGIEKILAQ